MPFRVLSKQLDQKGPLSVACMPRAPTHPVLSSPTAQVTCNI